MLAGRRQAQRFLDANNSILGDLNAEGGRKDFDAVTTRLATLAQEQEAHRINASGQLSNERRLARELRRNHMRPIVQIARWKVPAAAQLSAVTLSLIRSNNTEMANRARAMGAAVEPFRQLLHEGGLPADFIEQLYAAAGALEDAVSQKKGHQVGRVGTTDNIEGEVTDARLQVNVLDSLGRQADKPATQPTPTGSATTRHNSPASAPGTATSSAATTTSAPAPAAGGPDTAEVHHTPAAA
jgi:hypothetical protein